jgi:hypothetical protein
MSKLGGTMFWMVTAAVALLAMIAEARPSASHRQTVVRDDV